MVETRISLRKSQPIETYSIGVSCRTEQFISSAGSVRFFGDQSLYYFIGKLKQLHVLINRGIVSAKKKT